MNRSAFGLVLLIVFVAMCFSGCGEKAVEPGSRELAAGAAETAFTGSNTGRAHGRDDIHVNGTLLVATRSGIIAVNPKGESFLFHPYGTATSAVEVQGTRIFWLGGARIHEFDHSGNEISVIYLPARIQYGLDFTALPSGDFAIMDCQADSVYFVNPAGTVFQAVAMPEPSPLSLQNMRGLVVEGSLLVSETGTRKIAQIDLLTYAAGIFRDFSDPPNIPWFGAIEHHHKYFYIGRPWQLQRFTETGDLEDVADFGDEQNVTGIAILRHHAYVTLNFPGKLYQVNLSSGKIKCVLDGLDYPKDIALLPVVLEAPPTPWIANPETDRGF